MKALAEETVRQGRPPDETALDHLLLEVLEAGREPVMTAACAEICESRETLRKLKKQRKGKKGKSAGKKGTKGKKGRAKTSD